MWTSRPGNFIYRGQSDAKWGLVPSVLREASVVRRLMIPKSTLNTNTQIYAEMRLLAMFVEHCDSIGLRIPGDSIKLRRSLNTNVREGDVFMKYPSKWPSERVIELMALAQHHKLQTRLLDWSKRSYVAAYFAAADAVRKDQGWNEGGDLAIWALDISCISEMAPDDATPSQGGLRPPVSLVRAPGSTSANLSAQAGVFTLLKERGVSNGLVESRALEDEFQYDPNTPLIKFTLRAVHAPDVLIHSNRHGINAATLFPGYDGASAAVLETIKTWPAMVQ